LYTVSPAGGESAGGFTVGFVVGTGGATVELVVGLVVGLVVAIPGGFGSALHALIKYIAVGRRSIFKRLLGIATPG
jgi:hypothetical protein